MRIVGLTVSVNYADLLERAMPRWVEGLDALVVVTTPEDTETLRLVARWGVAWWSTRAFYEDGCAFNKGKAMSAAVEAMRLLEDDPDWIATFDADVIPPAGWRAIVEAAAPRPGTLYGAVRAIPVRTFGNSLAYDDSPDPEHWLELSEAELPGFFQLWHASDPNVQRWPLYDCTWRHAGGYDSEFQFRWPVDRKIKLPIMLEHIGVPGRNWWGRGNDAAADAMFEERRRTGVNGGPMERIENEGGSTR
jgi:hypothetical protein